MLQNILSLEAAKNLQASDIVTCHPHRGKVVVFTHLRFETQVSERGGLTRYKQAIANINEAFYGVQYPIHIVCSVDDKKVVRVLEVYFKMRTQDHARRADMREEIYYLADKMGMRVEDVLYRGPFNPKNLEVFGEQPLLLRNNDKTYEWKNP